jgi:hypothetical protein
MVQRTSKITMTVCYIDNLLLNLVCAELLRIFLENSCSKHHNTIWTNVWFGNVYKNNIFLIAVTYLGITLTNFPLFTLCKILCPNLSLKLNTETKIQLQFCKYRWMKNIEKHKQQLHLLSII